MKEIDELKKLIEKLESDKIALEKEILNYKKLLEGRMEEYRKLNCLKRVDEIVKLYEKGHKLTAMVTDIDLLVRLYNSCIPGDSYEHAVFCVESEYEFKGLFGEEDRVKMYSKYGYLEKEYVIVEDLPL
jgi:hypothetical protein